MRRASPRDREARRNGRVTARVRVGQRRGSVTRSGQRPRDGAKPMRAHRACQRPMRAKLVSRLDMGANVRLAFRASRRARSPSKTVWRVSRAEYCLREEEHAEDPRGHLAQSRTALGAAHSAEEGAEPGVDRRRAYGGNEPARSRRPEGSDSQERRRAAQEPHRQIGVAIETRRRRDA